MDDSLIFCSTISRAEKPSSRKENSSSVEAAVFMVTKSPFASIGSKLEVGGEDILRLHSVLRTQCLLCPWLLKSILFPTHGKVSNGVSVRNSQSMVLDWIYSIICIKMKMQCWIKLQITDSDTLTWIWQRWNLELLWLRCREAKVVHQWS